MIRILLSPSQREELFNIPTDITEQALVKHYTFSATDLTLIRKQREEHNRLGFGLQLAYFRFPGRPLQAGESPPPQVLNYVAAQLHLSPLVFRRYALRDTTRRQHARKIQQYLTLHQLTLTDEKELQTVVLPVALQTGSTIAVVTALVGAMRERNISLPAISTVEKLADEIQEEARRILFTELMTGLSPDQTAKLDELLSLRDKTQTNLIWLKNFPRRPTPQGVLSILDRIDYIDSLNLPSRSSNLYDNRISRLAREGLRHTPQYLARLPPNRRHGLLRVIASELKRDLIDQAILMHDKMLGQFFNRSEWQQKEAFHKRGKAINEKVRLYARIGKALIQAKEQNGNWEAAITSIISWEHYQASVAEAENLMLGENFDFLEHLKSRYGYLRQYVPRFLAMLPIEATSAGQPILAALNLLRELNASGKRTVPPDAPTAFITDRWASYIFAGKGIDRQYYEFGALTELRGGFRSGDVYVAGSRTHNEFATYLFSPAAWERVKGADQTGLAVPTNWETYIAQRRVLLHQRLSHINRQISRGKLPEVRLTDGRLHIGQIEKSVPEEALSLAKRAYSLVPAVKLTDLVVEVDNWTHFSDCFTRDDDPTKGVKERAVLYSAMLADATNLGLLQMAQVTPGITLNQLA